MIMQNFFQEELEQLTQSSRSQKMSEIEIMRL